MKWDARWRDRADAALAAPHHPLVERAGAGPGRALDLAGGAGRNGAWLAEKGWDVTVCDGSSEGLALAARRGLATCHRDLEALGLPPGPWDVIVCVDYLQRALFAQFRDVIAPGGRVIFSQPTVTNLERNPRPSRRFLLEDGELAGLLGDATVEHLAEGWNKGRYEAHAVFRP